MEDSKLYSTQDIEKLKEKIDSYKETLTTLKTGTSIEDYLFMKNEFEELKPQVAQLEELTETMEGNQSMQIKEYEGQVKHLSIQIESLNQVIEEMNHEILAVLNKLIIVEENEPSKNTPTTVEENTAKKIALPSRKLLEQIAQTTVQPSLPTNEPSYKFLQSLAGKASNMNNGIPYTANENAVKKQEERHFNQHYFQSINTHPSQIYNGLYRNNTAESTFHFKNATDTQGIPVSVVDANNITAPLANELDNTVVSAPLTNELENTEATAPTANELENTEASTPTANDLGIIEASAPTVNDTEIIEASVPAANDLDIIETAAPTVNDTEIIEASIPTANDLDIIEPSTPAANDLEITETFTPTTNNVATIEASSIVPATSIIEVEPSPIGEVSDVMEESIAQLDFNNEPENLDINEEAEEEPKKEKNSLFFNLFRRRN